MVFLHRVEFRLSVSVTFIVFLLVLLLLEPKFGELPRGINTVVFISTYLLTITKKPNVELKRISKKTFSV